MASAARFIGFSGLFWNCFHSMSRYWLARSPGFSAFSCGRFASWYAAKAAFTRFSGWMSELEASPTVSAFRAWSTPVATISSSFLWAAGERGGA